MRLDHVQISVRDVAESRRFYARWFGLEHVVHDEPGFTILATDGGGLLALHRGPPPDALAPTAHFGFRVADAAAVVSAHGRFVAAGLTVSAYETPAGGFAFARVIDPDGHHVEVYASPGPTAQARPSAS